jgi:hypothetical protein
MHPKQRHPEPMPEPGLHASQMTKSRSIEFEQANIGIRHGGFGVGKIGKQR